MKSIFFLSAGTLAFPSGLVTPEPFFAPTAAQFSCTVAVCLRDNGDLLLVDAGFSKDVANVSTFSPLSRVCRRILGLNAAALTPVVTQLEKLGFDRGQVKTIVATHCHFDHIGGLSDFPNATLITTQDELSAMGSFRPHAFYSPSDFAVSNAIRPVDLGGRRMHCFPSSLDLFGDSEVILLDAEGHTGGHLAVALRSGDGFFLHVGDAIFQEWEIGKGFEGPSRLARFVCADDRALKRTLRNLQKLAETADSPQIIPSHDMAVFNAVPHAPFTSP